MHKFHDKHSSEWTILALIRLEEKATEAHMVEVIVESHCQKQ